MNLRATRGGSSAAQHAAAGSAISAARAWSRRVCASESSVPRDLGRIGRPQRGHIDVEISDRADSLCRWPSGRMVLVVSFLYLLFRRALAVTALRFRSREFKNSRSWCCATSSRFFDAK